MRVTDLSFLDHCGNIDDGLAEHVQLWSIAHLKNK